LAGEVASQRFAIGDETLGRAIRQRPEFQTEGRFDPERYRQLLGGSRSNQVAAFEAQARDEAALNQFRDGIVATGFTLPGEAERLDRLARQQRTVDAVQFDLAAAQADIVVEEEAVAARFEQDADSFSFPPRAKIAWLELSEATLADTLDVTEDDARDWYEANRATFVTPEVRDASHILFAVDDPADADAVAQAREDALAAKARLDAGEPFAELAGELSDDSGSAGSGGSLGTISTGLMVPEFETALAGLSAVGDVSEPVTTEFGVHLVRLDALVPEAGPSFGEVRDEAMASAASDAADREFFELREQLAELAFDNPESLDAASEATGLEVRTSDWIEQGQVADPGSTGTAVTDYPQVVAAAFSEEVLQDGNNSDPIEIADRRVIVLRVTDDEGSRPMSLDDVRETLSAQIATERAGELLDEKASAAQAALAGGEGVEAIAGQDPLATAIVAGVLERRSTLFDSAAIAALFAAPAPRDGAPVDGVLTLGSGDRLAWRLIEVGTPEPAEPDAGEASDTVPPAPTAVAGADPRLGTVEFGALVDSLRAAADVELQP